jgi:hypothetical protein
MSRTERCTPSDGPLIDSEVFDGNWSVRLIAPVIWVWPLVVNVYVPAGRATNAFDPAGGFVVVPPPPDELPPVEGTVDGALVAPGEEPGATVPDADDGVGDGPPLRARSSFFEELHAASATSNTAQKIVPFRFIVIRTSTPR